MMFSEGNGSVSLIGTQREVYSSLTFSKRNGSLVVHGGKPSDNTNIVMGMEHR